MVRRPHLLGLLAACVCSMLLLPAGTGARPTGAVGSCIAGAGWGAPRPELADRIVALVNDFRTRHGLRPLHENTTLTAAAGWKARHMAEYGYMSHDDPAPPVSRTTAQRIAACGYGGGGWGENIAYGYPTPEAVMAGWLNSPGHRANIANPSYTAIGVGAAAQGGRLFWAQAFGVAAPSSAPRDVRTPARVRPAVQPKPTLVSSQLFHLQRRPHAGRKYLGQILVLDKQGERVRSGRVRCRARVGGRLAWNGVHRFHRGLATCIWRTPKWAHGGRLTGTIRVWSSRGYAVRWFSRRIR